MGVPAKLWVGAALIVIGLAGIVYTMPIVSKGLSSKGLVYKEADVPAYRSSLEPYTIIEVVSAAVLTGGIALCAMGYAEVFADSTLHPHPDTKSKNDSSNREKTEAASG